MTLEATNIVAYDSTTHKGFMVYILYSYSCNSMLDLMNKTVKRQSVLS